MKVIEVSLKEGHSATWNADKDEWDDYAFFGYKPSIFVIKKNQEWVGIYNMDCVSNIVVR